MATVRGERQDGVEYAFVDPPRREDRQRRPRNGRPNHAAPMTLTETIPDIVIRRLPVYIRTLRELQDRGINSVSSDELADHIGVTAAQIRRDLSYFGKFGKQGKG
ncbi:MAG: winged-helix domain-containing protein, partial [Thermomicrobiales bacterium]